MSKSNLKTGGITLGVTVSQAQLDEERFPAETVVEGFPISMLQAAFSKVADPADWKAPIRAEVAPADLSVVCISIPFYTATAARVSGPNADGKYLVEADGYRAGPAGP